MPQYTFRIDPAQGEPETRTETHENDEVAVHVARRILDGGPAVIRVGRGEGDQVQWLGRWESGGRHAAWTDQA